MDKRAQLKNRRVAVLVESSRHFGREVAMGIARFADECANWSIYFHERQFGSHLPAWIRQWRGDGVLIHSKQSRYPAIFMEAGLAVVSFNGFARECRVPIFTLDDGAIATMAAHYFIKKGFAHFAFCGVQGALYSHDREKGFDAALVAFGRHAVHFHMTQPEVDGTLFAVRQRVKSIAQWINRQAKPLALFACDDDVACTMLFACQAFNIRVPDEVAVLGVDNDLVRCHLVHPHLSSIQTDAQHLGYEGAKYLEQMMVTRVRPPVRRVFAPLRVIERESTDIQLVEDPLVQSALDLMGGSSGRNLTIAQLAERLGVCRTTLDTHFQKALRGSVHERLVGMKVAQARMDLESTNLPIKVIAENAGMSLEHFCRIFKATQGITPGAYRKSFAGSSA